jgi:hypothetical protein
LEKNEEMIPFILENPIGVAVIGGAAVLFALVAWLQTGQSKVLYVVLATIAVTAILVTVGVKIETEPESLRKMLYETANDLENNRFPDVIRAMCESPSEAVRNAKTLLETNKYVFSGARVKRIHTIDFSGPAAERRAMVKMNVFVEGRLGGFQGGIPRYVELTLNRVGQKWKVSDFSHADAFEGFKGGATLSSDLP